MDTETVNRVITEITNRLGVGYSTFSDAVSQYAQAKATENLIFSVAFLGFALCCVICFIYWLSHNKTYNSDEKSAICFIFAAVMCALVVFGIPYLTDYINWSNAPQGMFLREIMSAVK